MKDNYTVYLHTVPNGKVYVGITRQDPKKRWGNGINYKHNKRFYNAIKKYGWENIQHEILFTGLTKDEAAAKEIELIKAYHSIDENYGYNILEGGFEIRDYLGLPTYDEMEKNPIKAKYVLNLIKLCKPTTVTEIVTTEDYEGEKLVNKKVETKKRVIEPDLLALNSLIGAYENEPRMKDIIDILKKLKERFDK